MATEQMRCYVVFERNERAGHLAGSRHWESFPCMEDVNCVRKEIEDNPDAEEKIIAVVYDEEAAIGLCQEALLDPDVMERQLNKIATDLKSNKLTPATAALEMKKIMNAVLP